MFRGYVLLLVVGASGCMSAVHPRVGTGVPAPDWVEVPKAAAPEEEAATGGADSAQEIRARHILIMHNKSMRAPASVGRTRDQAYLLARELLARARAGEDFVKLAAEYSDDVGSRQQGGDLGSFSRDKMVKKFADAAFALQPGDISDVVESPFGFHIIQRTE